jgi:hypothetical protein
LSLPTRRLIAEGLKRRDELIGFLAWLETPRVRVEAVEGGGKRLTGTEQDMFDAIRAGGEFNEQCHMAGVEPLCGARTVQHLCLANAVTVTRASDLGPLEERDAAVADDDAVRECVRLHVKLLAEFTAPIVAVEGGAGIRERLERVIEEAASRYPELLFDVKVGGGGVLDPEEMIHRALSYPGEREREVRLALGELVSYLEFELTNHPKIPRPEDYLEDLQELRAQL